jgi:chromosome segregation ATPase
MEEAMTQSAKTPAGSPVPGNPGMYRRTRRKLGRLRRQVADPDDLRGRLAKQRRQLDQQATQIADLKAAVATLGTRIRPIELASSHRELEHGRAAIQVGQVEERLGRIEERLRRENYVGDASDHVEARSLVAEVRREHEQVRIRMQVIGQYEERLRRVEDAVLKMYKGDVRHPF